jgi:hypothetical protein
MLATNVLVPSWLHQPPPPTFDSVETSLHYQCILTNPIPSKVYKHDNQTVLTLAFVDSAGMRLAPLLLSTLDCRVRIVKEADMLPVLGDILKVGEAVVNIEDCTIQIPFRITQVSKNYNNSNFILVVSQPHSLLMTTIVFDSLYTDAFRVLAKRPDAMTTKKKKDVRQNKRYKTPDWVEPWAKCAFETLQKNEWSQCVGVYVGTDGRALQDRPILFCRDCGGFQAQGHVFGCQYKKLLRNFNRTILVNPKLQSSRRKKQRLDE